MFQHTPGNAFWIFVAVYSFYRLPHVFCKRNQVRPSCPSSYTTCEFHLTLTHQWTMVKYSNEGQILPIVMRNDTAWAKRKSCNGHDSLGIEELENTINTGDGSFKDSILINGQLPGPAIVVYRGQQVVINVTNAMVNEVTTVHWHGVHQKSTPWMDGVAGVSQCPIQPGQTYTYRFIADPVGTHWYHTHLGTQRSMGAYGAFIVLATPKPSHKKMTEAGGSIDTLEDEFIMIVGDWMRKDSSEIAHRLDYDILSMPYGYGNKSCYSITKQADGIEAGITPWISGLINGKGRHYTYGGESPEKLVPVEKFRVKAGALYKFRLISAAMSFALKLSIDHHTLHVVALDGAPIKKKTVDAIIINSGERVDFLLQANFHKSENTVHIINQYWIRVQTLEMFQNKQRIIPGEIRAILNYGKSHRDEPETQAQNCSIMQPCVVLNCPYRQNHPFENIDCVSLTDLRGQEASRILTPEPTDLFAEQFLNFHFAGENTYKAYKPTINGKIHVPPVSPIQVFAKEAGITPCDESECEEDACQCTHLLNLPHLHTVQLILFVNLPPLDEDGITGTSHPIHIHGHNFQVVKIGWPTYDPLTNRFRENNPDIECVTPSCNKARWANSSWAGGNVPDMVEDAPVLKDTVTVPGGGYVVIRFIADNPGFWYLHCHTEFHNELGMALVIKEGDLADMNAPPEKFPMCGSLNWTAEQFNSAIHNPISPGQYILGNREAVNFDCPAMETFYKILVIVMAPMSAVLAMTSLIMYIYFLPKIYRPLKPNRGVPTTFESKHLLGN